MPNDFVRNNLVFDSDACYMAMKALITARFNSVIDELIKIFQREIDLNGNGSHIMKADAKSAVREASRTTTDTMLEAEIGFDESYARTLSTAFYVRTMVVIYGNKTGGPLYTKPGSNTWKKHVLSRGPSNAKTVYRLKNLEQTSKMSRIRNNAIRSIQPIFKDMLKALKNDFSNAFFESFLTVR